MEIALIIIYNHKYNKNIEIVEKIYKNRFSNIYHLVPFYEGSRPNVIAVYGNSFYFQGYIAQGYKHFYKDKFNHYFFVADDMIINPIINEKNYSEHLKLKENSSFIPRFVNLNKDCKWPRIKEAYHYNIKLPAVEAANELPSYEKALEKFSQFGLPVSTVSFDQLNDKQNLPWRLYRFKQVGIYFKWIFNRFKNKENDYKLPYPLIGAYSDIFIIPASNIKKFCHFSGVFAATHLFVEIAIPTALVLSAEAIITENDLEYHGKAFWPEGWLNIANEDMDQMSDGFRELEHFGNKLKNLLTNFPTNYLYVHPVKLSQWNTEI